MPYVELHAASAFSFLDGASLPEALIERAAALDYPALALLDRDGLYGAPRFHLAAKKAGLKAIIGAELTIVVGRGPWPVVRGPNDPGSNSSFRTTVPGPRTTDYGLRPTDFVVRLPVLVESPRGYKNL